MPVLDSFGLGGRVAVVTGGNRGLGRAFATALGEAGASVAILARDTARSDAAVRELTGQGIRAAAFFGDVARRPDVDRAVDEIATALGRVDILVNNAGTCIHRPALEVTDAEWREAKAGHPSAGGESSPAVGPPLPRNSGGGVANTGALVPPASQRPAVAAGQQRTQAGATPRPAA